MGFKKQKFRYKSINIFPTKQSQKSYTTSPWRKCQILFLNESLQVKKIVSMKNLKK
jgi:hypothetical protein